MNETSLFFLSAFVEIDRPRVTLKAVQTSKSRPKGSRTSRPKEAQAAYFKETLPPTNKKTAPSSLKPLRTIISIVSLTAMTGFAYIVIRPDLQEMNKENAVLAAMNAEFAQPAVRIPDLSPTAGALALEKAQKDPQEMARLVFEADKGIKGFPKTIEEYNAIMTAKSRRPHTTQQQQKMAKAGHAPRPAS